MNDRQLQTFFTIVNTGSFSKAEETAFISRQALKKQIDALESELGFQLFRRTSKGIQLTGEGQRFYEGARSLTSQMNELVELCRNMSREAITVRISNPSHPVPILENAFHLFSQRYPQIRQDIVFQDRTGSEKTVVNRILSDDVDVAEVIRAEVTLPEEVSFFHLADLRYYCIMNSAHPLAHRAALSFADLDGQVLSLRHRDSQKLLARLEECCPHATLLDAKGNELRRIISVCYNGGVFLSKAFYSNDVHNLVSIPLDCDIVADCGIIYKNKHRPVVDKFLGVVREIYPI